MNLFQRILEAILAFIAAIFGLSRGGPVSAAGATAAATLSAPLPVEPDPDEDAPLGALVREHAIRLTLKRVPHGAAALDPLPGRIAAWLAGRTEQQISAIHAVPAAMIEEHVTGQSDRLDDLLGACPQPPGFVPPAPRVAAPAPANDDEEVYPDLEDWLAAEGLTIEDCYAPAKTARS
ncbi:hypothetical protein ASG63_16635 [Methylobacterium sp. Leaf94]|uniref:hypothetical protein n=1 Tax=Methylobacterium sp. Leaf94 TaxID=1736250 RepID=UPI0006FA1B20|nr:hypothetical protein [Methylobacterium sp. Leaf94]KQU31120.1 hypothetical protein ASG63_16635 [Methylobacterium sp. Leaf94]